VEEVEEVVRAGDGFEIVCKNRGVGRTVARATDPRA
jgi:hypothetical protein